MRKYKNLPTTKLQVPAMGYIFPLTVTMTPSGTGATSNYTHRGEVTVRTRHHRGPIIVAKNWSERDWDWDYLVPGYSSL